MIKMFFYVILFPTSAAKSIAAHSRAVNFFLAMVELTTGHYICPVKKLMGLFCVCTHYSWFYSLHCLEFSSLLFLTTFSEGMLHTMTDAVMKRSVSSNFGNYCFFPL